MPRDSRRITQPARHSGVWGTLSGRWRITYPADPMEIEVGPTCARSRSARTTGAGRGTVGAPIAALRAAPVATAPGRPGGDERTARTGETPMRSIARHGSMAVPDRTASARALGWFSIALGAAELAAPRRIGAYLGMADRSAIVRVYGLREVATGVGILARRDPSPGLWARVGGDVLDLATLGSALARGSARRRAAVATGAVAAITALDVATAQLHRGTDASENPSGEASAGIEIQRSVSIGRSPQDLYALWKEPETLSKAMGHAAKVTHAGEGRFRWVVERAPFGKTLEWETHVVADTPERSIRWESLPGASVRNSGEVEFRPAPGDWGTEVTLSITLEPPGGALGAAALRLAGPAPDLVVGKALRRFKSLAETGEIPVLDRQPAARKGGRDD